MRVHRTISAAVRRGSLVAVTLLAAALAAPGGALAASAVSSNWSGYVARAGSGRSFSSVSAAWTVPTAACTAGRETHSAVWVGLGGYSKGAKALEQAGTDSDCGRSGRATYSSWVELLPAAASTVRLKVLPGDRISASVTVRGRNATLRLSDLTTGKRYWTTRRLSSIDVSTADWIVEAPSGCDSGGSCRTLNLTNFGSVAFTNATATSAGHTGPLGDSRWPTVQLLLRQGGPSGTTASSSSAIVSATPSAYAGGAFSVAYGETAAAQAPAAPALPGSTPGAAP
ncbi:MAG: hypothetical protein JWM60_2010 [Solirubrobacterales bacterium]|nr:hypothetical protein [Solirubrobacterales bacterium]